MTAKKSLLIFLVLAALTGAAETPYPREDSVELDFQGTFIGTVIDVIKK